MLPLHIVNYTKETLELLFSKTGFKMTSYESQDTGNDIKNMRVTAIFEQHKEDQQIYLDDKFNVVNNKLDARAQDCKDCRKCLDEDIEKLGEKIEENNASSTKKVIIGSGISSFILWMAFGADALHYLLALLGKIL
jgi:predicted transcriptional regulator